MCYSIEPSIFTQKRIVCSLTWVRLAESVWNAFHQILKQVRGGCDLKIRKTSTCKMRVLGQRKAKDNKWSGSSQDHFFILTLDENVKKAVPRLLIYSRCIHLIWRFYYNASVNSHSQLSAYSKETHTKQPVVGTWNSAIYGAIKHVSHTCLFGYV